MESWSVVDVFNAIALEKTGFLFPRRLTIGRAYCLVRSRALCSPSILGFYSAFNLSAETIPGVHVYITMVVSRTCCFLEVIPHLCLVLSFSS